MNARRQAGDDRVPARSTRSTERLPRPDRHLNEEIEELDDHIEDWSPQQIRRRISDLRHDILHVRRTLSPDARRHPPDRRRQDRRRGRQALFPRERRDSPSATRTTSSCARREALDYARDLLTACATTTQPKIAQRPERGGEAADRRRLAAARPDLHRRPLRPELHHIPEINDWGGWGYVWSWLLIVVTTIGQLWYFRRKQLDLAGYARRRAVLHLPELQGAVGRHRPAARG